LKSGIGHAVSKVNWASWALGASIVGIEVGFLLAYRAGWNVSLAGIATNTSAALLLLPIGLLIFKDKLSLVNIAGVLVCILGLLMINWKR